MISYMDYRNLCMTKRTDKVKSYTRMFAITDYLVQEEIINHFYVKHLDKDNEELHFISDQRVVIVKRHSGNGENVIQVYPLKIKNMRFRQNWQEYRQHRIDLELEDAELYYDSQSDCVDHLSEEYSLDIENIAKTLLLK